MINTRVIFPRTRIEGSRTNNPTGKVVCASFIARKEPPGRYLLRCGRRRPSNGGVCYYALFGITEYIPSTLLLRRSEEDAC